MKIAVISDIHSNITALQSILKNIRKRKVDKILCAGDIIGYGPRPNKVVAALKKSNTITVAGNHDRHISLRHLECFNPSAREALIWNSKKLTEPNKQFIQKLPKTLETKISRKRIFLVHGSPFDPLYEYVYPTASDTVLKKYLRLTEADILIMGHTHMPFARKVEGKLVLNPGSVGQPRDANPMASYCILDLESLKPRPVRVEYDIEKTAIAISEAGLPGFLAQRLCFGI